MPEWDGWYFRGEGFRGPPGQWLNGTGSRPRPAVAADAEYQQRMTQMNYHEAVSNAPQWMASFCIPKA